MSKRSGGKFRLRIASVLGGTQNLELDVSYYVALLSRLASRDFYDAASLLSIAPDLPDRPGFRLAFVCQAAASRADFRELRTIARMPEVVEVRQKLLPLLRIDPDAPGLDPDALAKDLHQRLGPAIRRVLKWSKKERAFLDRFLDSAEIDPILLTEDPVRAERVRRQPMLLWKQQHLRKRAGM